MRPAHANRIGVIEYSPIRAIFDAAHRLEAEGRDVVHLELGDPNFDSPAGVKNAAIEALGRGDVHYTPNRGLLSLRQRSRADLTWRTEWWSIPRMGFS
jgi:aspartate/methionine/tyrosine aminotransferase